MVSETVGATLPADIEVDETAAYFGVVESSDILHQMREMNPQTALAKFVELTADLHLRDGEFDFEDASERMNCEGGEIYYLVVGHFGLMAISDPLRLFLGQDDSQGNLGTACTLPAEQQESLNQLCDTMTLLKLFSIAQMTEGPGMVVSYVRGIEALMANPSANVTTLININSQLQSGINSASSGSMPQPIIELASSGSAAITSSIDAKTIVPLPQDTPSTNTPLPSAPSNRSSEAVHATQHSSTNVGVSPAPPLNPSPAMMAASGQTATESIASTSLSSPPTLSSTPTPHGLSEETPDIARPELSQESKSIEDLNVDTMTDRQLNAAADDVFGSAFGDQLAPTPTPAPTPVASPTPAASLTPTPEPIVEPEPMTKPEPIAEPEPMTKPEPIAEPEPTPTPAAAPTPAATPTPAPASQGEKIQTFLKADKNQDGHLDKPEIVSAVGSTKMAESMIDVADEDGDGVISLPEYLAQPENIIKETISPTPPTSLPSPSTPSIDSRAIEAKPSAPALPKPVAPTPVRRPVGNSPQTTSFGQTSHGFNSNQPKPSNGSPSGVVPVIRSGKHCRGCKIGLDPHWRYCPICGASQ